MKNLTKLRWRGVAVGVSVVLGWPGPVVGLQLPEVSAFDHECSACHMQEHQVSEGKDAGPSLPVFYDLSPESRVCLRCHLTPERRFAEAGRGGGQGLRVGSGRYLDLDIASAHPVGRTWRAQAGLRPSDHDPLATGKLRWSSPPEGIECSDCHRPHPERPGMRVVTDEKTICSECHDPGVYVFEGHVTPGCGDCHSMHEGRTRDLLRMDDSDLLCSACHEGGGGAVFTDPVTVIPGPRGHTEVQLGRCVDCHRVHGARASLGGTP